MIHISNAEQLEMLSGAFAGESDMEFIENQFKITI